MVEAEKRGILVVTSPYTIHFTKTPTYFKPGMPFQVLVYVTNPDDTPAEDIDIEVTPGPVVGKTQKNGMAKLTINTKGSDSSLPITVRTKSPALTPERQASAHMTAKPYKTLGGSKNYLHISIQVAELEIGDNLQINLYPSNCQGLQGQDKDFTYLVLSKGQIVQAGRYKRSKEQSLVTLSLPVTKDMIPSFRFVAYYHVGSEVVSDSVWVDVKGACMGMLKVTATKAKDVYEPRKPFGLTITGDPGARVGLVAVDKGVYVLNRKNRLTQTKIWDIIEKHDIGCTFGSGADSMGVFYDAGLAFASSAVGTSVRSNPDCPVLPESRRRRSLALTGSKSSPEDDNYFSDIDIVSRTQFFESWLWEEVLLPVCSIDKPGCKSTSTTKNSFMKDSITTWEVTAVSLSKTHGICVSDPFEMKVMKQFFIDLKLPYAAVHNEQLEIKAVLHNYNDEGIMVRVVLMETEHVCSAASKKRKYRAPEVFVDSMSSRAVPFVIIPMALGLQSIEVKASVYGSILADGVRKDLLVVPHGLRTTQRVKNLVLDPSEHGGVQTAYIPAVKLKSQVPGSPAQTYISVTAITAGDLQVILNVAGRSRPIKWAFDKDTAHLTRSEKTRIDQNLTVTAKGSGQGTMSVVTIYNALPEETKQDCKKFELKVKLEKEPRATDEAALETYKLTIEMLYLSDSDATMSILYVTLLTGFIADMKDLERLTSGTDRYVQKIETDKQLSEKGSLIFYLDKVSHKLHDRVIFRIHKMNRVGLLQPAAITLYEYYSMENRCMKFYHPEKKDGPLNRICHEDVCRCAEENCSYQKKRGDEELDRLTAACSADYVYKAKVIHTNLAYTMDHFTILIEDVIKEGTDPGVEGKQRTLMAHPYCREAIGVMAGKSYLIMGRSEDLIKGEDGMKYMLGGETWIEFWPKETECQEPAFREACLAIRDAADDLRIYGCPN
ncbi:hypothetical protein GJAV_G00265970 [Gymnothorax javanicus]|nr:hypothetical protein GJAV_G00265970 [Gymnothorax javanicus]